MLIFFVSYPVFLLVWIHIEAYYGGVISAFGGRLAGWSMGATMEKIESGKDGSKITFAKRVLNKNGLQEVFHFGGGIYHVSGYAFNVPLTFGLIVSLLPFFHWRKRSYLEAGVILAAIHTLFVYLFVCRGIYVTLTKSGLVPHSFVKQSILDFVWSFTNLLIIRFEPFLIIGYLWLRSIYRRTDADRRTSGKARAQHR